LKRRDLSGSILKEAGMANRLTETQLAQVVAEVTRLSQRLEDERQQTLEREELARILKELDLPAELIDDAMVQVNRRQSLARQRRRNIWIISSVIAIILAAVVITSLFISQRNASLNRILSEQPRITRSIDNGGNLQSISRDGQEVYYRVVLRDVPLDETLSLSCNWFDPAGRVFRQNRWETRPTDKTLWPTSCRCTIGQDAPTGNWRVEMSLGDRILSGTTFRVE
jgi:hypothetical protein